ncbi:MAG TPA: alpha/beta hydrolase [Pyrinomonadaceae bacterium]|jgi:hypothetical protein
MNLSLRQWLRLLSSVALCLTTLAAVACAQQTANSRAELKALPQTGQTARARLLRDIPKNVETQARYLFYLHGWIIENQGVRPTSPQYGVYQYQEILESFARKGFIVVSEARPKGTDVQQYAAKVVDQIRALLKAGVPPQHITVAGASKGGVITVAVSTLLKNRDVNFVILAACGESDEYRRFHPSLWGNVLSIYDDKDNWAVTCRKFFEQAGGLNRRKEIVLKLGLGHGILYRPLKEWVEPTADWASQ